MKSLQIRRFVDILKNTGEFSSFPNINKNVTKLIPKLMLITCEELVLEKMR